MDTRTTIQCQNTVPVYHTIVFYQYIIPIYMPVYRINVSFTRITSVSYLVSDYHAVPVLLYRAPRSPFCLCILLIIVVFVALVFLATDVVAAVVLALTHRHDLRRFFSRVMCFVSKSQDGTIVESGNHAELLSLGEHFVVFLSLSRTFGLISLDPSLYSYYLYKLLMY